MFVYMYFDAHAMNMLHAYDIYMYTYTSAWHAHATKNMQAWHACMQTHTCICVYRRHLHRYLFVNVCMHTLPVTTDFMCDMLTY